ncbi:hypothetical protein KUIN1_12730 [Pseudomonas sp. KUIN-1]|nr:hypothetical protein KUIN1_12730 [Pseudomonas sp. KUIN-1]
MPGYLLLRRLDRRPLDQDAIKGLIPADEAVGEARRALPFGRGNIDVDAQRSNLESGARTLAARRLRKDAETAGHEPMPENEDMNWHVLVAMSGQVFGAGNCGEHARLCGIESQHHDVLLSSPSLAGLISGMTIIHGTTVA